MLNTCKYSLRSSRLKNIIICVLPTCISFVKFGSSNICLCLGRFSGQQFNHIFVIFYNKNCKDINIIWVKNKSIYLSSFLLYFNVEPFFKEDLYTLKMDTTVELFKHM